MLTGRRLVLHPDGSYQAFLAEPDRSARAIDPLQAREIADRTVRELELKTEMVFDGLTMTQHAGASRDGDETEVAIADFTAHYRQTYDGTPVARGGDGHVSIVLDPAGTVCSVTDRTASVAEATEAAPSDGTDIDVDGALGRAEADIERRLRCEGRGDSEVAVVPDSRDVCYRFDRDSAVLVAREEIEIRTGQYAIRKVVEVAL